MFCPKCGSHIGGDAFCRNCGQGVSAPVVPRSGTRKGFIFRYFAVVLVGAAILVGWLTSRQPAPTPEEKAIADRNLSRQAANKLATAKAQIEKKDYVGAKLTLNLITQNAVLAQSAENAEAKRLLEKIDPLATRQAQQNPHPARAGPDWAVATETSPMDGSRTLTLSLDSDSAFIGGVKFDGMWANIGVGGQPSLVIRCDRRKTNLYVVTGPASQEFADSLFEHTVRLKFDDGKPITQTWTEGQRMESLFAPNPTALAKRLAQAKSLNFEFTSYERGRLVLHFNVDGFDKRLPLVRSACGW